MAKTQSTDVIYGGELAFGPLGLVRVSHLFGADVIVDTGTTKVLVPRDTFEADYRLIF